MSPPPCGGSVAPPKRTRWSLSESKRPTRIVIFLFVWGCVFAPARGSERAQEINKLVGDNVTLQCELHRDAVDLKIEWIRADLGPHGYVFIYRDGDTYENYLHDHFKGRVIGPEIKNNIMNIALSKVTVNDTGRYECHVTSRGSRRSRRSVTETTTIVRLTVTEPGGAVGPEVDEGHNSTSATENTTPVNLTVKPGGAVDRRGLIVGLVSVVMFVVVVLTIKYVRVRMNRKKKPPPEIKHDSLLPCLSDRVSDKGSDSKYSNPASECFLRAGPKPGKW